MKPVLPSTPNLPQLEEEVLAFWEQDQTFRKSIEQRDAQKSYVFYDGPPFATGMPHYGHIVASTLKDIVPRYWTMKGYRVERKWGWDCHGLPIENIAEKELGIKRKKEIEELGVAKFNETCRSKVLSYVDEWKKIITRLGRWADMEHDYKTMDLDFMESVWWVFKQLYDQGLVYEDYRSMHICPRCETTLSQSEVAEGYKDVTDISVVTEFLILNFKTIYETNKKVFALAWTTTPWTLPGNFLLAINPNMTYLLFSGSEEGKLFIAAEDRLEFALGDSQDYQIIKKIKGSELVSLKYEPLFPYFKATKNAFRIVAGDFVKNEEGTGIVHIAPGFGEDDYKLGKKEAVELIQHVGYDGRFTEAVADFVGLEVKPKDNPQSTDIEIIKYLAHHDRLWSKKKLIHSYPHCWRCDTPLLNYATSSWFVAVSKIKPKLLKLAQEINWSPAHIKDGRWGNWLEDARDWSISRQRYWASVMPIWKCDCGELKVYGSVADLEADSGQKITDLHKHIVDEVTMPCPKCKKTMHRIPDVLDTWFDSGSMPYGQEHYPFADQAKFEQNFPAEFIGEGVDQTRAWFYYLHVIAGGVMDKVAYKNVIVNGIVLAEDGKKMSKRLQNYPDPVLLIDKYGSDSLRLYLTNSPVLKAENLNFSEQGVAELRRKVLVIWWNVFKFYYELETGTLDLKTALHPTHVLDRWLLSKLNNLTKQVSQAMDAYDIVSASRYLIDFIGDLSNWYLRLSRNRLKEEVEARQVLGRVLYQLAQLYAPFTPFFTEVLHHYLVSEKTSIHLTLWPKIENGLIDSNLEVEMSTVQKIVEQAHALRQKLNLKLRQPLAKLAIYSPATKPGDDLLLLLAQESNVKKVLWKKATELKLELDSQLTPELQAEGEARELMRAIQILRKQANLQASDLAKVTAPSWPADWQKEIEEKTNSKLTLGEKLAINS